VDHPINGREAMKYFRMYLSLCLFGSLSFISLGATSRADAASFTYTLSDGFSGFITTTCDNCALDASNITAWSISVGGISVSSTSPGAQLMVPAGDNDLVATPNGIAFLFEGPFGALTFKTATASIVMSDDEGDNIGFGPGIGAIEACTVADGCTFVSGGTGSAALSTLANPFTGPVTYSFTGAVTAATGTYASAGTTVTGTFTFDLGAGDGALPVPFTTPWTSFSTDANPQVLGSTLKSGGATFSDAGSVSNNTSVAGAALAGATLPSEYFANDTEFSTATNSVKHSFQLVGGVSAKAPFDANGLPVFANATGGATGSLTAFSGSTVVGQLSYILTSLGPATTSVSLSPSTLNFPSVPVGTISALLTATLTNSSDADLKITGIQLVGDGDFRLVENNCGSALAVQTSCTLVFDFLPSSIGPKQATLSVNDSAANSPQTATLTGMATPTPMATLSAVVLNFPSQQVGASSASQAVNLTNKGSGPLNISSVSIVGAQANDFVLRNACVPSLAPGRSCTIFVTFKPVVAGALSATLSIVDNDTGSQQSVTLSGTATAVPAPVAKLNAASLSFASQPVGGASAAQAVVISNTGTAPLTLSSVSIVGAQASDFALQDACVSSLAPGRSCALFVTFKPLTTGAISATLSIVDNATGSQQSVVLSGVATAASAPVAKLNTASLNFANEPVGTASAEEAVVLSNTGTAALNISSVSIVGPQAKDFVLRNACVASLPASRNCALFVTFKPVAAGAASASLSIVDNATGSTQSVALTGTAH
jgi:hypothetical protein